VFHVLADDVLVGLGVECGVVVAERVDLGNLVVSLGAVVIDDAEKIVVPEFLDVDLVLHAEVAEERFIVGIVLVEGLALALGDVDVGVLDAVALAGLGVVEVDLQEVQSGDQVFERVLERLQHLQHVLPAHFPFHSFNRFCFVSILS